MIIELRGVEFVNKGAELMLHAILKQVREEIPNAVFVMEKGARTPMDKLKQHQIFAKFNSTKFGISWVGIANLLPKTVLRNSNFVLPKEIDVILDGSGFAFGDQWGAEYAEARIGSSIIKWKNEKRKIVLLPQAFGPFKEPDLRKVMLKIIQNATLIFTREQLSYEYLRGVSERENIHLAPDFTNLIKGTIPKEFDSVKNQVAIIPNYKMIEQNTVEDTYTSFLINAITQVKAVGLNPYFLIHEGQRDQKIAQLVNEKLQSPIDVIRYDDALVIKGIISTAKFIICSRFHGVVSALSQGIPCLATSWSHKYEMLTKEYDYSEGIIKDLKDKEEINKKISFLADSENNSAVSKKLSACSTIQKERSKEMWKLVFKTLKSN